MGRWPSPPMICCLSCDGSAWVFSAPEAGKTAGVAGAPAALHGAAVGPGFALARLCLCCAPAEVRRTALCGSCGKQVFHPHGDAPTTAFHRTPSRLQLLPRPLKPPPTPSRLGSRRLRTRHSKRLLTTAAPSLDAPGVPVAALWGAWVPAGACSASSAPWPRASPVKLPPPGSTWHRAPHRAPAILPAAPHRLASWGSSSTTWRPSVPVGAY